MNPLIREVFDLVLRWVHLIAGIMWVGNSMLFNWLDRNLDKEATKANERSMGEIWMLHSGAYYQVEKKMLAPTEFPKVLHWFKWQSYTTWLSGISLLAVVYYMQSGGAYLVDPTVSGISVDTAMDIGLASVFGGFLFYDLTWRILGKRFENVATALTIALVAAAIIVLPRLLSGRAAYIHVGVLLGTIMSGNVFLHIVPSQRQLVEATKKGTGGDLSLSAHAKQRSIHNNYFTFPLLFIMVSNHFPSTYGSEHTSLILAVLVLSGAGVRHCMNVRFTWKPWFPVASGVVLTAFALLFVLMGGREAMAGKPKTPPERVAFSRVQVVLNDRCVPCHAQKPTDPTVQTPPGGVMFETPEQIKSYAERIKVRAVVSRTMPLANKTHITEDERDLLAKWILAGAKVD